MITADDPYDYVVRNRPADVPLMEPQRFVDRATGPLILARNPARLRPDLLAALDDHNLFMRLGAVAELEAMLGASDVQGAAAARRALETRFAVEEHVKVYKRIEAALSTAPLPRLVDATMRDLAVFRDVDAPWCPQMVALPAGEFLMGSPDTEEGRFDNEGPQHQVNIDRRYAIGRFAVTLEEYDHFCAATGREKPEEADWVRSKRPMIDVSWRDAIAYCEWLAKATGKPYRLASEAEWVYPCRAGTTTRYSVGDKITETEANFGGKVGEPTEVGAYPANPWGLYDMHGNVWEWVEDVWYDSYQGAPADGSAGTEGEGKESFRDRVSRGGSWCSVPLYLSSVIRYRNPPDDRSRHQGFRVAGTLS